MLKGYKRTHLLKLSCPITHFFYLLVCLGLTAFQILMKSMRLQKHLQLHLRKIFYIKQLYLSTNDIIRFLMQGHFFYEEIYCHAGLLMSLNHFTRDGLMFQCPSASCTCCPGRGSCQRSSIRSGSFLLVVA